MDEIETIVKALTTRLWCCFIIDGVPTTMIHQEHERNKLRSLMMLMKMEFKLIFDSIRQWDKRDIYLIKLIIKFAHVQKAPPD